MGFVACVKDRKSETVRDAFNDFNIDLRRICRFHAGRGGELFKHTGHGRLRLGTQRQRDMTLRESCGGDLRGHLDKGLQVAVAPGWSFQGVVSRRRHVHQRSEELDEAKDQRHKD